MKSGVIVSGVLVCVCVFGRLGAVECVRVQGELRGSSFSMLQTNILCLYGAYCGYENVHVGAPSTLLAQVYRCYTRAMRVDGLGWREEFAKEGDLNQSSWEKARQ